MGHAVDVKASQTAVVPVHQPHALLRRRLVARKGLAGTGVAEVPVLLHVLHECVIAGRRFQAHSVLAPGQHLAQIGLGQGLLYVGGVDPHVGALGVYAALKREVSRAGRVVATIVDEAHWAKNPKSKRGIATPKEDMDIVHARLKIAEAYVKELRK